MQFMTGKAAKRLKAIREQTPLSIGDVAKLIGMQKSSYQYYEDKYKKVFLPLSLMQRLAPIFKEYGVPEEDTLELGGIITRNNSDKPTKKPTQISPDSPPMLPPRHEMPLDVPVYGTAAGSLGQGSFQMASGEIIDRVRRTPGIANAKDVYALYIEGESMSPRYDPGELVYVSEKRPVRVGDYVIVQVQNGEHEGIQAYIKKLIRRKPDWLVLEQLNPPATIEIETKSVKAVHRILTMNELAGV